MTADHDLARRVVVGDRADIASRRTRRDGAGVVQFQPQQGRHRALADRHRLLHRQAAGLQQPRGIREAHGSRRRQRRIFAQRVAGDEGGVVSQGKSALRSQDAHNGHRHGHQRRLRVLGQAQVVVGPFEHQLREALPERVVDLLKYLAGGGKGIGQRPAHADLLRSLAGKYECHAHCGMGPWKRVALIPPVPAARQ
jgi:hypothetical protein